MGLLDQHKTEISALNAIVQLTGTGPSGSATSALQSAGNTSLTSINTKLPPLGLALPAQTDQFIPVMQVPQKTWRNGFDRVFASGFDPLWMTTVIGSGMTVAQSAGSAVITTGTTANSETIGRSLISFDGSLTLRFSNTLSQRIANQQFFIEMVDVIGDNLAFTINSTTSITVTFVTNPFTSANVGQSMYLGNLTGTAGTIPGRYTIASVSGLTVTFTVVGFPASGSGTVSLFGWNYHHVIYDSTTATSCTFDSQRNGWNSGETTATINTTASPGHIGVYGVTDGKTVFSDQLSASSTTLELTQRGSRVRNVPVDGVQLYVQIRALNGSSAPASTTTWTLGFIEIDNYILNQMSLNNIVPQSANSALPVQVLNTPASTITSGTITAVTTLSNGQAAHSAASSGSPLRIAGRVNTSVDTTLIAGDTSDQFMTTGGASIVKSYAVPEVEFNFLGSITNSTTAVVFKAASGASIRNYITSIILNNDTLGAASELVLKDGAITFASQTIASNIITSSAAHDLKIGDQFVASASTITGLTAGTIYYVLTVPSTTTLTLSATPNGSTLSISGTGVTATANRILFRTKLQTASLNPITINFQNPLRGAPNVTTDIQTITASITGTVYYNISGYNAP